MLLHNCFRSKQKAEEKSEEKAKGLPGSIVRRKDVKRSLKEFERGSDDGTVHLHPVRWLRPVKTPPGEWWHLLETEWKTTEGQCMTVRLTNILVILPAGEHDKILLVMNDKCCRKGFMNKPFH